MRISAYRAIAAKSFRSNAVYSASLLWGIALQLPGFLLRYFLWHSLIGAGVYQGTTLRDMTLYVLLTSLVGVVSNAPVEDVLDEQIKDGSVALNLLRPISFKMNYVCTVLGENIYRLVSQLLPIFAVGILLIGVPAPENMAAGIGALLSLMLGVAVSFQLHYVVGLMAFWLQRTWYLSWYIDFGMVLFGGGVVPLWFFPAGFDAVSWFLPFRYISYDAINIYLGRLAGSDIMYSLIGSAAWLGLLLLLERCVWKRAMVKLCVNGG